jgi:hypothetical protein
MTDASRNLGPDLRLQLGKVDRALAGDTLVALLARRDPKDPLLWREQPAILLIRLDLERQRVLLAREWIAIGPRSLQRTLGLLAITIDFGVVVPPDDDPPSTGRRIRRSPDDQNVVDGLVRGRSPSFSM